jgi:predicted lipid carrier protein YhbT
VYENFFFSFLLEVEGVQESGLYEKNCIDELFNYLGGYIEKKKFPSF